MNLDLLRKYGTLRKYDSDSYICTEGEQGSTAFLLLDGYARVVQQPAPGQTVDVASLTPGELFGEMSLLENKPRIASVIAERDETVVLELGKEDFLHMIKAEPDIGYGLLSTLLGRVNNTLDQMGRNKVAFVAEIKRDKNYQTLQRLSKAQFIDIAKQDSEYALTLLKFLSHTLAQVDRNI